VDGLVELCVEDSGPGIPLEQRALLFHKYHTSLEVVTQGNGIGLTLCKNLVTLLKGDIFLDESYDSGVAGSPGSRFVVKLNVPPLPPNEATTILPTEITETSESLADLPGSLNPTLPTTLSVLFVDDDKTLRKLFVRSIKRVCPHWTVSEAASGEVALALLENIRQRVDLEQASLHSFYDLIFVDQFMASTSERPLLGTETVAAMRRLGVQSRICGLSANDIEKDFLLAGADTFHLKPLPFEEKVLKVELLRVLGCGR
jgi:CheY-like chemotaxis protein